MKRLAWVVKKRPLSIVIMHPLGALSRIEAVALLKTKSWRKKKRNLGGTAIDWILVRKGVVISSALAWKLSTSSSIFMSLMHLSPSFSKRRGKSVFAFLERHYPQQRPRWLRRNKANIFYLPPKRFFKKKRTTKIMCFVTTVTLLGIWYPLLLVRNVKGPFTPLNQLKLLYGCVSRWEISFPWSDFSLMFSSLTPLASNGAVVQQHRRKNNIGRSARVFFVLYLRPIIWAYSAYFLVIYHSSQ